MDTFAIPELSSLDPTALARLQRRMHGELLTPDSDAYNALCSIHDQRPAMVARCLNAHDVILAIIFARERKLEVAVGGRSLNASSMLIDLSQMRQISIDPLQQIARVQPGATSGEFEQAAAAYGLAAAAGSDAAIAVEIVTADGALVTASAREHPDLFWAARGGSGDSGIVTAITYQLRPFGQVS